MVGSCLSTNKKPVVCYLLLFYTPFTEAKCERHPVVGVFLFT